jgi:hypothetical protein
VPDVRSVIEALRSGDETAFVRLVDHYHASLGRVARLSGNRCRYSVGHWLHGRLSVGFRQLRNALEQNLIGA